MPKQTMEQTINRYCGPSGGRFVRGEHRGELFADVYRTAPWYFKGLETRALHKDFDTAKSYFRVRQSQATGRRSHYF
jgi:hypothetical protein